MFFNYKLCTKVGEYSKGQFVLYHNNPTREFLRKVLKAFI